MACPRTAASGSEGILNLLAHHGDGLVQELHLFAEQRPYYTTFYRYFNRFCNPNAHFSACLPVHNQIDSTFIRDAAVHRKAAHSMERPTDAKYRIRDGTNGKSSV